MRYYILDDLADPVSGDDLWVKNATIERRNGPLVAKCQRWCGFRSSPPANVEQKDCITCASTWIVSGELVGTYGRYWIRDGIPRLLPAHQEGDAVARQTQRSFGYEWKNFNAMLPEYRRIYSEYFSLVPEEALRGATVLDAGCGMGRWAYFVSQTAARRLYVLDFSTAIEQAAVNLTNFHHAHAVQGDVSAPPFRAGIFDLVYSLGVLHHVTDPNTAMARLALLVRGSGRLLVYLYYALDNRPAAYRWLLSVVSAVRLVTSRLPKPFMHSLSWLIAATVYWPLATVARLFESGGFGRIASAVPLSGYRHTSLRLMVNDAFDRFATPLERRYSRAEIREWLGRLGFQVQIAETPPYWVALGHRSD